MKNKRLIVSMLCMLFVGTAFAANPEERSLQAGGYERKYLLYTPQNKLTKPNGVIVALHGFNGSMHNFFDDYQITPLADMLNYIVIAPQALPEQNTLLAGKAEVFNLFLAKKIKLDAVWSCGLKVRIVWGIPLLDDELNKVVDDVDFIRQTIEKTLKEQSLSMENIFIVGTSMGGYMAYQFAMRQPVKVSGIVSIAGSMGLAIKGMEAHRATAICDFHSVTDEVVPYAGAYNEGDAVITLAQSKTDVINYWATNNQTGLPATENVTYYPSTNGISVAKITYPHPKCEVVHYKINGASHSYIFRKERGDCMDYMEEIGKFITAHSDDISNKNEQVILNRIHVYPNPVNDVAYVTCPEGKADIYDLSGKKILSVPFHAGNIDVSALKPGWYIFRIYSEGAVYTTKVLKS